MIRDKVGSLDGSWDQSWQVLGVPSDFCGWQAWVDVVMLFFLFLHDANK
jgi:hypothetical protein